MPSNILEVLKEHVIKRYIEIFGIVLVGLFYLFAHLLALQFPHIFGNTSIVLLWQIILYQLVTILLIIPYIIYLLNKLKNPYRYFDIDDKTGVMKNKKDGHYYCPSCFQNGTNSIMKTTEDGWQCLNKNCNKFYGKEGYTPSIGFTVSHSKRRIDRMF